MGVVTAGIITRRGLQFTESKLVFVSLVVLIIGYIWLRL